MPFKLNQDRRHHIPRQQRKVSNRPANEVSLRQRGSLRLWFTDDAIAAWAAEPRRPVHLLVDSTGLKLCGAGEWLVEKHGTKTRRGWRTLHLGVDGETGQIVASALTGTEIDDGAAVGPLLDQITEPLASVTADGAYDQDGAYAVAAELCPRRLTPHRAWGRCVHIPDPCTTLTLAG